MLLYHATYRTNLPSIRKFGLGAKQSKNWDFSEDGVVCLATDPDVAYSFCEANDEVAESKYNSGIIVFAIESKLLDSKYSAKDNNIKADITDGCGYYTYSSIIPPQFLNIVTAKYGIHGPLPFISRAPAYE